MSYLLSLRHRNHLSVMNANVAAEIDNGFTFDFTVSPTETFAGHQSMQILEMVFGE